MTLSDARQMLHRELLDATGETIGIDAVGKNAVSMEVQAVRAQNTTESESTDTPGLRLTAQQVDWIVDRNDLATGYLPQTGDVITDAEGRRWQVCADQRTSRPWRLSGPDGRFWRIHSKPEGLEHERDN